MKRISLFTKVLVIIALSILTIYATTRLYFWLTDDFTIKNITSDFSYSEKIHFPSPDPSQLEYINKILHQNYSYLGKGAQVYAFLSEDNNYILKFVKQKHYVFTTFERILFRLPFFDKKRQERVVKKQKKRDQFFASCLLCYRELPQETALIYIHLAPTTRLHNTITITDKLGLSHDIDLDYTEFIIQKRAQPFIARISTLMGKQDITAAQHAIDNILALFKRCCERGYTDRDAKMIDNIGFVGDQAIFIDIGEMYYDERLKNPDYAHQYLIKHLKPIHEWLQDRYPELSLDINRIFG